MTPERNLARRGSPSPKVILRLPLLATLLAAVTAPVGAWQGAPTDALPTHRYYFDQRLDWPIDGRRLLVRAAPGVDSELLQAVATAAAAPVRHVEAFGVPSWFFLWLDSPTPLAVDLNQRIELLLESDRVEFASPVFFGEARDTWVGMTQEILVRFHQAPGASPAALLPELAPELEVIEENFTGIERGFRLGSESRNGFEILELANGLAEDPRTEFAEPNTIFSGRHDDTPNDPYYEDLWALDNVGQLWGPKGVDMDVDVAWEGSPFAWTVRVLVLDTGVELSHPDLNIGGGADFTQGTSYGGNPGNSCDNHGTAVAGCISAKKNNSLGVVGVAPESYLYSARVGIAAVPCNGTWTGTSYDTAAGINWGYDEGCRVSNNSNSYGHASSTIATAYSNTYGAGMVHFASAGNDSEEHIAYPANLSTVNAVGSINGYALRSWFSNYGPGLAFAAPGEDVRTTDRTGSDGYHYSDYVWVQGTSFSSPYTAGVAALILRWNAGLGAHQVEEILQQSATDLGDPGYDEIFGYGLPNAARAVLVRGYEHYGTGTPGCDGPQTHSASFIPVIGTQFKATCNSAPPDGVGNMLLGFTADIPGTILYGGLVHVPLGPTTTLYTVTSDSNGDSSLVLDIPDDPNLIGLNAYTQFVWRWPSSICTPSEPFGLSTSNGLAITFE